MQFCYENALDTQKFWGIASIFMGKVHAVMMVARRFSAASSALVRCSQNIEAAGTPSPILLPQAAALQKPTGLFAKSLSRVACPLHVPIIYRHDLQ